VPKEHVLRIAKDGEAMTVEVYIPKFGQTVEEVTLLQWLAADGATIKKGQEILEIETDKTTFFVEAEGAGTLHRGPFEPGVVVPVLTVVATIGAPDEKFVGGMIQGEDDGVTSGQGDTVTAADHLVTSSPSHPVTVFASPRARKLAAAEHVNLAEVTPTGGGGVRVVEKDVQAYLDTAPKATPLAEKLAAEAGINLRSLAGTGPAGKITKEDVEAAIKAARTDEGRKTDDAGRKTQDERPPVAAAPSSFVVGPSSDIIERIPLKGVRGIIAERMGTSVHTTARVTLMLEADATEFVAARERIKAKVAEEWGYAPGYNDLLAKIVAAGLRKFPYMNARLAPDAIERLSHVNMGMAVDTERGLLVPVIRDADQKSLRQFGAEFREMVERARKGRSLPDDISGGTFTITNLGMYDIEAFTPVINLPEAAILGVGKILPKWVFRPESPDKPVLRQMMALSLVFDHRIIDGAPAAKFLQYVKQVVEEPYLLLAA
jgi:pyruvate dehydrogenase E2 component (dihydrolipoamide acetyltransferase)